MFIHVKKFATALLALSALLLTLGLSTSAASADVKVSGDTISALEIGAIGYNASGVDTQANRNSEYVDITNTSDDAVDVGGLVVEDAWAHGDPSDSVCNTYTVGTFQVVGDDGVAVSSKKLPAGHTLRVYVGAGTPAVNGKLHSLFMDSNVKCGNAGHFFNNTKHGTGAVAWDVVYITHDGHTEWKSYNFDAGFVVR